MKHICKNCDLYDGEWGDCRINHSSVKESDCCQYFNNGVVVVMRVCLFSVIGLLFAGITYMFFTY